MQSEFEGISKLRKGVLVLIIAAILVVVTSILAGFTLAGILTLLSKMISVSTLAKNPASIASALSSSISSSHFTLMTSALGIIGFASFILVIVGYSYLRRGFKTLNIREGYAGTTLFFSFLVLFILGILIFVGIGIGAIKIAPINPKIAHGLFMAGVFISVTLVGIAFLLLIISNILLGIGFYRVGSKYDESVSKVGGILVLLAGMLPILFILMPLTISAVASFLYFLGIIFVYAGLMRIRVAQKIQQQAQVISTAQQPQQTFIPQIYQVGQGIIRSDGFAHLIIYSNTQVLILSARIESTNINSVNILPVTLIPGQNGVIIKFDNVSSLKPGTAYVIAITINVGGNISEIKAVAVYQQ